MGFGKYPPSNPGGTAIWGDLTGTLSDQTDLQSALNAKIATTLASTNILVGNGSNVATAVALSGDASLSNAGALTIANNAVTLAKMATISTANFLGRTTAGTGNVESLTATQATALLNGMVGDSGSGGTKGLVPAPASGDAAAGKYLKADGTWTAISSVPALTSAQIAYGDGSNLLTSSANLKWDATNKICHADGGNAGAVQFQLTAGTQSGTTTTDGSYFGLQAGANDCYIENLESGAGLWFKAQAYSSYSGFSSSACTWKAPNGNNGISISNASTILSGGGSSNSVISTSGWGIFVSSPQAQLHVAAGSTAANNAPIKINSGTLQTTAEAGTIEYNGNHYITDSNTNRTRLGSYDINAQSGTTYTFVKADSGKVVTGSNAGATTYTVPTNASVAFSVGAVIRVIQVGAGKITFAPAGGVTINSALGFLSISAQYSDATLIKTATDTWSLLGTLSA